MSKTARGTSLLAASVLFGVALVPGRLLAQSSPVGTWQQFDDRKGDLRSIIRIDPDGQELAGTIVKGFPRPGEPEPARCDKCPEPFKGQLIEGLRFMWGLKGNGREWDDGRVLDPDDGKIYRVKLRLSEDGKTLDVRGYIGVSLFGRTQKWKRAQ
jgi:uncharacterized protein (DUF2147 family)